MLGNCDLCAALYICSSAMLFYRFVRLKPKTEPKTPTPNSLVCNSVNIGSLCLETEVFNNRTNQTEFSV